MILDESLELATIFADKNGQATRDRGEPWSSAIAYHLGEYAEYDGRMYRCTQSHLATPSFNPENWIPCTIEVGDYVDYVLTLLSQGKNLVEVIDDGV